MDRQMLIASLEAAGIRPNSERDLAAIEKTAEMLRQSAVRVAEWLESTQT